MIESRFVDHKEPLGARFAAAENLPVWMKKAETGS